MLRTVDLEDAVGADVVPYDLAPGPDGLPVALVGDGSRAWLVDLDGGAPMAVAADPDSHLVIAGDGTPLVVSSELTRVGGAVLPLPLDGPPDAVLLDGDVLHVASGTRLAAVDVHTGEVRATATTRGPVTHLAGVPDGGAAALVDRDGVDFVRLPRDLRPDGDPVTIAGPASTPAALQVTADGTAVATLYVNEAQDAGRLVTVVDGRVHTVVDLEGTDDTALDLAVDPAGRTAYVVLSASYHPAELTAVDLVTGEVTGVVGLCGGAGAFGAMTPNADGSRLAVIGSCIDADGPDTTAFVIG